MSVSLLVSTVFFLCGAGIALSILVPPRWCPGVLAWIGSAASLATLWLGAKGLVGAHDFHVSLWSVPELGVLTLSLDHLASYFLIVSALALLPASIFAGGFMRRYSRRHSLKVFNVLYLSLLASIVLILLAGDILLLLLAWEAMSILSYLLVNYEHRQSDRTQAGYLMLAMGEAGTLAAAFALLLLALHTGSMQFGAIRGLSHAMGHAACWAVFLLSFFGFGVKAGLVPFNSWLPRAYAAAPAAIAPVLAGVTLNLGFYGILRVNGDLLHTGLVGPGVTVLVVGTISALIGILYATTENDLRKVLAHSSVENAGIIAVGVGAGLVFTATGHPVLAALAFVAALYHMANHTLYKSLLFMGAAAVDAGARTRDLDHLGGLIRRMPWTALLFLAGALSIAALPPFNGFVSEWLTLQMLLRSAELSSVGVKVVFALCGAGLALTAALAVTCFVKAFAMGFLGTSRSARAGRAREAPRSMVAPMGLLAALCLLLGVLPTYVISALDGVVKPMTQASAAEALVPPFFASHTGTGGLPSGFAAEFHDLGAQVGQRVLPGRGLVVLHRGGEQNPVVFAMSTSYMLPVLLGLLGVTFAVVWVCLRRRRTVVRRPCWDGGVRRLLPEMTYTATGFSNPVRVVFDTMLRPITHEARETVAEHFRAAIHHRRQETHMVDRYILSPLRHGALRIANALARAHHGRLNAYVAYVLLALLVVLVIALSTAS